MANTLHAETLPSTRTARQAAYTAALRVYLDSNSCCIQRMQLGYGPQAKRTAQARRTNKRAQVHCTTSTAAITVFVCVCMYVCVCVRSQVES